MIRKKLERDLYVHFEDVKHVLAEYAPRNGVVLDVGCGLSNISELLVVHGYDRVIAIDSSKVAIEEKQAEYPSSVQYLKMDAARLSIANGSIYTVFSKAMLDYTKDEEQLFRIFMEWKRVLQPGGVVILVSCRPYQYWRSIPLFHSCVQNYFTLASNHRIGTPQGTLHHHQQPYHCLVFRHIESIKHRKERIDQQHYLEQSYATKMAQLKIDQQSRMDFRKHQQIQLQHRQQMLDEDYRSRIINESLQYDTQHNIRRNKLADHIRHEREVTHMNHEYTLAKSLDKHDKLESVKFAIHSITSFVYAKIHQNESEKFDTIQYILHFLTNRTFESIEDKFQCTEYCIESILGKVLCDKLFCDRQVETQAVVKSAIEFVLLQLEEKITNKEIIAQLLSEMVKRVA